MRMATIPLSPWVRVGVSRVWAAMVRWAMAWRVWRMRRAGSDIVVELHGALAHWSAVGVAVVSGWVFEWEWGFVGHAAESASPFLGWGCGEREQLHLSAAIQLGVPLRLRESARRSHWVSSVLASLLPPAALSLSLAR